MDKATILIVEDNGILATHLQDILLRHGYAAPDPVATGEAAILAVNAAPPNLVLMDVQLAGAMDGIVTANCIRMDHDIPIVYLTAFSHDLQLEQAKSANPYGYLVKPVSERELLVTLDIALHKHTLDRRLKISEERLALALDGADLGTWDWDARTGVVTYNERWAGMLGYRLDEIEPDSASWQRRIHPDDLTEVLELWNTHLDNSIPRFECEHRLRHKDGHWIWVLSRGKVIERDPQDHPLRACGTHLDISERRRLEDSLRLQALTDPLTGAFNRRYFMKTVNKEISRAQRYSRPLALIMFDIDHFKRINDTFGHESGDVVLKGITALVRQRLRQTDILVRWGGEEFMILAVETPLSQAVALAETLLTVLRETPFARIGPVTASFGVTEYRLDETLDQWLKRIDDLVYEVKREGRNQVRHSGV